MRLLAIALTALVAVPLAGSAGSSDESFYLGRICSFPQDGQSAPAQWSNTPPLPVASCPPAPTAYESLPSTGQGGRTAANLTIGYDPDSKRLCFVATGLPLAPVLRVGVGHRLSVRINNTLHDSGYLHNRNCAIETYGGEGLCEGTPVFPELPGPDGSFYPIEANEAHMADGTANLHVHGLFVPPTPCSDEVLQSTAYPSNWHDSIGKLQPCQARPDEFQYNYDLPSYHPAGVYWYHTHRHGESEHETQMGLYGAIVVQDEGDAWRASLGVTDEVLVVGDVPNPACVQGPNCDVRINGGHTLRQPDAAAARQAAWRQAERAPAEPASANGSAEAEGANPPMKLDPRIDQIDQAGECAYGASGPDGGVELWTLLLNGAPVPEVQNGFPPDNELLSKTMQPNQRQIFRLVNASANSWLAPELVLNQGGTLTTLPLEVFARDGVGITDAAGRRIFHDYNVAKKQLLVQPAGRVEFVVHAPPAGAELYLQSSQVAPGCGGNAYPARRLLLITLAGSPVNGGEPGDRDLLKHTPSLAPYLSTLGTEATVHRTFVLSEYSRAFTYGQTTWPKTVPTTADYNPLQTDFFITEVAADDNEVHPDQTAVKPFNGHGLAPNVIVHLHGKSSVTEEWLVQNSTLEIHAFHMHQIHFRVVSENRDNPELQPLLDTVTVPAAPLIGDPATGYPGAPGYVKLRMTFTTADIGTFVFHCHLLEHEDNGMMGKIQVVAD